MEHSHTLTLASQRDVHLGCCAGRFAGQKAKDGEGVICAVTAHLLGEHCLHFAACQFSLAPPVDTTKTVVGNVILQFSAVTNARNDRKHVRCMK